jgi:hypothetical protein
VEKRSNYIDWIFKLELFIKEFKIEYSDYDEFHVNDAIEATEYILDSHQINSYDLLTEKMVDEYTLNAIKNEPDKKEYYETISYYVKKRLLNF